MTRTSISLTRATKADLDDVKKVEGESYESVIQRLIQSYNDAQEPMDESIDKIVSELQHQIDTLAFDGAMTDDDAEQIINRIDDLESQLPRKVANEVQNR